MKNRINREDAKVAKENSTKTIISKALFRHSGLDAESSDSSGNPMDSPFRGNDERRGFTAICPGKFSPLDTSRPSRLRGSSLFGLFVVCLLFAASDAHAMHISEGILPFNWAMLWFVLVAPFVAYGLYRLRKKSEQDLSFKPLVGLMTAVVFIISCMPVPVPNAGTCSHPCGTGISGILLGPVISVLISAAALLIQALFLAHGGLSTLGADIMSMGVVGSFAGYGAFRLFRSLNMKIAAAAFGAGLIADWATYLTTSVELAAGIRGDSSFVPLFGKIVIAFIPTQLPLGILEGAMTAGMITLLSKKRPDLLVRIGVLKAEGSE